MQQWALQGYELQPRLMGMSLTLQVFIHKIKFWTNWKFDLMMAYTNSHCSYFNSSSVDHVCAKCHGIKYSNISLQSTSVNQLVYIFVYCNYPIMIVIIIIITCTPAHIILFWYFFPFSGLHAECVSVLPHRHPDDVFSQYV